MGAHSVFEVHQEAGFAHVRHFSREAPGHEGWVSQYDALPACPRDACIDQVPREHIGRRVGKDTDDRFVLGALGFMDRARIGVLDKFKVLVFDVNVLP